MNLTLLLCALDWTASGALVVSDSKRQLYCRPRVGLRRKTQSILLWKEICGNSLLAKMTLILFLNKVHRVC